MFTVLNGGKDLQSKVKFSKFYLIFDMKASNTVDIDIHEVYLTICSFIEKTIAGSKAGMVSFKKGPDGTLFNAFESINESFKLLEDAIAHAGVNKDGENILKIGVNTDAQGWFLEDLNRYEWEPKTQYDTN